MFRRPFPRARPRQISVVIPAHNAAGVLGDQLDALSAQTYDGEWEIVVVDNRSTDDTRAVADAARKQLPVVRVLVADELAGANYARNAGARAAVGDLLAFCDADDVAEPGWLAALATASTAADAVGGRLDDLTLNDPAVVTWRESLQASGLPDSWDFLPYAMCANAAVWHDVFTEVGGFDEHFVYGSDDVDFFWRLQLAGYRLQFAADAVIKYRHRGSMRDLARQHFRYGLSEPLRYRKYRDVGAGARPLRTVVREWGALARSMPAATRDRDELGALLRMVALRAGRVVGSIRERAVYL